MFPSYILKFSRMWRAEHAASTRGIGTWHLTLTACAALDANMPVTEAFKSADDILRQGVRGISDIITVRLELLIYRLGVTQSQ